jgi:endonuclease YncB( thermonuclease family)
VSHVLLDGMVAWLAGNFGKTLILITVSLVALAVISRQWNCKPIRKREPWINREVTVEGTCTAVLAGNRIEVTPDRRRLLGDSDEAVREAEPVEARGPREYRLAGVIVDDPGTLYGGQAVELLKAMLLDKRVRVELDSRRETEAEVYSDGGMLIQVELLYRGLARLAPSHDVAWESVEKEARKKGLGVWGE